MSNASAPRRAFPVPDGCEAKNFLSGRRQATLVTHAWTEGTKGHAFRLWEFDDLGGRSSRRARVPH
ncbi:hypothetical protein [Streptomyces sp. AK02-01A]|uniref:hypothetical protein n=1 Tax=Streptomyces sp. AK02-01A TaxID=3028648 RepID=UPI0029AC349F|nr:hypothetical protein [Streptomyces sp. AK02-01A]MDX3854892.1 hypothetical protein [Streptomyces sp. AK02-01A]